MHFGFVKNAQKKSRSNACSGELPKCLHELGAHPNTQSTIHHNIFAIALRSFNNSTQQRQREYETDFERHDASVSSALRGYAESISS